MKCSCGFKFADPGEFRNCDAFIARDGRSAIVCPDCGSIYIDVVEHKFVIEKEVE